MRLSNEDINRLLELAVTAAVRASDYIQSQAGKHRDVMKKQGGSSRASQVVTEVDLESQRLILESLNESLHEFELGLLTEETQDDASRHQREHFWCIDPLDGTLPFIEGVAGYSVSIALVSRSGDPVIGVIHDPVEGTLYHASRGRGAYRKRQPFDISPCGEALTLVMDRSFQEQKDYGKWLDRMETIAERQGLSELKTINQGGAAMNACWVIENAPAVYFKLPKRNDGGGSLWDFAASACLFHELKAAVATDIAGQPLKLNREESTFMNRDGVVYASSEELGAALYQLCEERRIS